MKHITAPIVFANEPFLNNLHIKLSEMLLAYPEYSDDVQQVYAHFRAMNPNFRPTNIQNGQLAEPTDQILFDSLGIAHDLLKNGHPSVPVFRPVRILIERFDGSLKGSYTKMSNEIVKWARHGAHL